MFYKLSGVLGLLVAMLLSIEALAGTDYNCVSDCTGKGYLYSLCQNKCSYPDSPSSNNSNSFSQPKGTDYQCVNDCTAKGYMYNYCKSRCSY